MPKSKLNKKYANYHVKILDLLSDYTIERLKDEIGGDVFVAYSNYGYDSIGIPINNLDDIAFNGTTKFYSKNEPVFGKGSDYESADITNPTWLDVAKLANEMIKTTGDKHHIFLEGIKTKPNGKSFFLMGS